MSLKELLQEYCKYKILRPASITCYAEAVRNFERYCLSSNQKVPDIECLTVDIFLSHRDWCLIQISAASYNKHLRHLKALLRFSVEQEILTKSPLIKVSSAPAGTRRPKVVPRNWFSRMLILLSGESVKGLSPPGFWKTAFSIFHFTGMRRRQLVELTWDDVLTSRSALILSCEGAKSKRESVVPIPKWLMSELKEFKQNSEKMKGEPIQGKDQVFNLSLFSSRIRGERMGVEHVSRAFRALSEHLGYTISSHRVRHTSASVMLNATGNLKGVSDMLSHSDIKLTASTYIHPQIGHLRRVQASLAGYKKVA